MVDGARHIRDQFGVAVWHAGDEQSDLGSAGDLAPRREGGPAFEVVHIGLFIVEQRAAVDDFDERLMEVVVAEDRVSADFVGVQDRLAPRPVVRCPARPQLNAYPYSIRPF